MVKIKLPIFLSLLSGFGLAFSLPFFNWGWLVFLGLVPLLTALTVLKKTGSSFSLGYLTGLIYFGFTFRWFWDAYPLRSFSLYSPGLALGLIAFAWFLTAAAMALFWGMAFWIYKKNEPQTTWLALLIFPSIFTFFEFLRSFLLSLLWFAPGTAIGPHWTAGNLAYALQNSPAALHLSSVLGIYGLTFLIALINVLVFLFLEHRRFKSAILILGLIFTAAYLPLDNPLAAFHLHPWPKKIEAAIIQTAIPSQPSFSSEEQLRNFKKQLTLLDRISVQYPQTKLVVFPEGSNFFTSLSLFGNTFSVHQYFDKLFSSSVLILDNARISKDGDLKSRSIHLDSKQGIVGSYDKYLLTPGGEYVPSIIRRLDQMMALNSPALRQIEEFRRGDSYPATLSTTDFKIRSLVCSDVASPFLARSTSDLPDILTVQASFAFVNGSPNLVAQTKAMARFRAAENQRALIFSSNFGPSFMLSPEGKVVFETKKPGFEILTGELVLNKEPSLYNKIGDGPLVMASFSVLVLSFFWREKKKKTSYARF